jgi:hypothetical protein
MSKKENNDKPNEKLNEEQRKYFIQMLDIKEDTNMTRIYSAICKIESLYPNKNKDE